MKWDVWGALPFPRSRNDIPVSLLFLLGTVLVLGFLFFLSSPSFPVFATQETIAQNQKTEIDRSPVDLVLTPDGKWLLTANQTSSTVSLVNIKSGKVVAEVACGKRPSGLALTPDGRRVLVTGTYGGDVTIFALKENNLEKMGSVYLGFEPRGVVVSPDGKLAYVALETGNAVAVVDLQALKDVDRIGVGRWPRYLALTPDGKRLAVSVSGDGGVAVVHNAT